MKAVKDFIEYLKMHVPPLRHILAIVLAFYLIIYALNSIVGLSDEPIRFPWQKEKDDRRRAGGYYFTYQGRLYYMAPGVKEPVLVQNPAQTGQPQPQSQSQPQPKQESAPGQQEQP